MADPIQQAFSDQPQLQKAIQEALHSSPQHAPLLTSIATYILSLRSSLHNDAEPASKRRRVDLPAHAHPTSNGITAASEDGTAIESAPAILTLSEPFSFLLPARKKFALHFTSAGLLVRHPASGAVEASVPWNDIQRVILLPLPERPQPHHAFLIFPPSSDGISPSSSITSPIVFTLPSHLPPPAATTSGPIYTNSPSSSAQNATLLSLLTHTLNTHLPPTSPRVITPSPADFSSAIVQPHLKAEKALFAKSFLGSKEGFLFFLPSALLFAFKKPILHIPLEDVESVAFTNVLQRTFNIEVVMKGEDGGRFEFGMVDQRDFEGVNAYVKRTGVEDGSFRGEKKAKVLNLEGRGRKAEVKEEGAEGEGEGGQGVAVEGGEEEDEEGEDYDPGSEGESEGSGTSDSEDGGDGEGGEEEIEEVEGEAEEEEEVDGEEREEQL